MTKVIPELWAHQKAALEKADGLPYFAFLMEPGVGKSPTTIRWLCSIFNKDKCVLATLILCPQIIIQQWFDEWQRFSGVPKSKILMLKGSGKKRLKDFMERRAAEPTGFIVICNFESLGMDELFKALQEWVLGGIVVADESTRIKSYSAKRTKRSIALAQRASYKAILSGSPILNSVTDLFSQVLFLDNGKLFGRNFFVFRNRYMYDAKAGWHSQKKFPEWKERPGVREELGKLIAPFSFQAKKSECLTLPPLVQKTIKVEMGKDQKIAYEDMRKNFIATIKTGTIVAEMALTKSLRMLQILCGFATNDTGEDSYVIDNPRMDALEDLLEDIAPVEKCIVWVNFKANYGPIEKLCVKLGLNPVLLTGLESNKKKDENIALFRSDPTVRVVIANPQAAGLGVNLVEAGTMIFYSRNYSLENDTQANARCYRAGSEIHKKITRIDLVCDNSLDEVVLLALQNKRNLGDEVLNWAKNG